MTRRELSLSPSALLREQERQRKVNEARRRRVRVKQRPGVESKRERRRKYREETAAIRAARMEMCQGRCEAIEPGPFGDDYCSDPAEHMHHLLGGSGRRRQKQTVKNVRMLCEFHHREVHRAAKKGQP